MKISGNSFCPCGSQKKYKKCCRIFHFGETPSTALELMKSRYSAYVANNPEYIINTTHKENSDYTTNIQEWKNSINSFSKYSDFKKLEIIDFIDGQEVAYVTFKATIFQGAIDSSFIEKSKFIKEENRWLYHSGEFIQ
ncbi:YchJ family protein [Halarcobacter bivalviorum]|uniref:YchJ family protein (SEC-C domain) n=1 Tax=Halarcobacter bivalviorum TaxID=663364 RepID=A0AAX2A6F7_9BACT|nr:YchJ family metal-binding protein [Halarcobacter bivalviorum]AXH13550.1 YchJ family protein (SEC-C domain) [Halarcobacter bivalviorum]RXK09844.1 hypothetical protein CRV05_08930 [Halarcobacter bivalviorum]